MPNDEVASEFGLALFEESFRAFARVLVEHQFDVAQYLVFDPLHRVTGQALVAGILDRTHRSGRAFRQFGRELVRFCFELGFRINLGSYAKPLRFVRQYRFTEQQ